MLCSKKDKSRVEFEKKTTINTISLPNFTLSKTFIDLLLMTTVNFQVLYCDLYNRGYIPYIPYGDIILYTISTGYVLWMAALEPQAVRSGYREFLMGLTGGRLAKEKSLKLILFCVLISKRLTKKTTCTHFMNFETYKLTIFTSKFVECSSTKRNFRLALFNRHLIDSFGYKSSLIYPQSFQPDPLHSTINPMFYRPLREI